MIRKDLLLDIRLNPRDTEDSRIVASRGNGHADPYISGIPDAQAGDENELEAFFAITAERLLYRGKVLGFPIDDILARSDGVQSARPFGSQGPTYAELSAPNVSIAVASVPLTPGTNNDNCAPVLARLYCVTGLDGHYDLPFLEGGGATGIKDYSWFVAGVKSEKLSKGILGRSWLLTAKLLMCVLRRKDKATATNLAKNFIVTGDVEGDRISRVSTGDMGRKMELGKITEFRSMKWIMPSENANGQEAAMKNRIEKPATLEEAYELIEHMSNRATRSFFRFLKASNLDGIKDEYKNGADIFADDAETGKGALQLASEAIAQVRETIRKEEDAEMKRSLTRKLDRQLEIRSWLYLNGSAALANAKVFYALAKEGMDVMLDELTARFPINARDEEGLTVVDWALLEKDWDLARRLHSRGGHCDVDAINNKRISKAIEQAVEGNAEARTLIQNALQVGLNPDANSLFSRAIRQGNIELTEACIDAGRDPNAALSHASFEKSDIPVVAIVEDHNISIGTKKRLIDVLSRHGAAMPTWLDLKMKRLEARSFIDEALKGHDAVKNIAKAVRAIKEGSLSIDETFCIDDYDAELNIPEQYRYDVFALALEKGWLSVIEVCLEKGVSPVSEVNIFRYDWHDGAYDRLRYFENSQSKPMYPVVFVKRRQYDSETTKQQLLDLLRRYIPKDTAIPQEAMP